MATPSAEDDDEPLDVEEDEIEFGGYLTPFYFIPYFIMLTICQPSVDYGIIC